MHDGFKQEESPLEFSTVPGEQKALMSGMKTAMKAPTLSPTYLIREVAVDIGKKLSFGSAKNLAVKCFKAECKATDLSGRGQQGY